VRQRLERAHAVRAAREAAYEPSSSSDNAQRTIEVATYVTVVSDATGRSLVSDATVQAQLDVLNDAYSTPADSPVKWIFALEGLARVKAPGMCEKSVETSVKAANRKGGPGALNLYITDLSDCGVLGFSSWPWQATTDLSADGVVLHFATLPGGTYKPYDMGWTAVHEIGHWFGLYHVFEHGCEAPGDSVHDTAFAAGPSEGCGKKKTRKTCPGKPGLDPVGNPMDYADDACMEAFTVVSVCPIAPFAAGVPSIHSSRVTKGLCGAPIRARVHEIRAEKDR